MKSWRNVLISLFLAGLVVWGIYDNTNKQAGPQSSIDGEQNVETGIQIGNRAPDFTLQSMDGAEVSLSNFKGRRVLLNFWATWCPPCRAEMPHLQKLHEKYNDRNIVVLGVNLSNTEDSIEDVEQFIEDYKLSFPIIQDREGESAELYDVNFYPTSYLIDSSGIIRKVVPGAMTYDSMKQYVEQMD